MPILELLRVIFGSVFVLFLPGFCWTFLFFDKEEIDIIERVALSFGLSIALVPLMVFYLNYLFHIKINLFNVSAVILGLVALAGISVFVKMRFKSRSAKAKS